MVSGDFVVGADLLELDYEFFGGREAWAEKFPEVRDWLGALPDDSTQRQYRDRAYRYFRWLWDNGGDFAGKLPGELVDLQDGAVGKRDRYAQLKMLQRYVNNVLKGTRAYKEQFISAVRSFYGCNYVELPRDPRFSIRADRDSVIGSLTREEARTLLLRADMPYRAVYACMLVGFMGRGEFLWFNSSEQVRRQIVEGADVIRCDIPGRKKGKPFYSLVGGDGRRQIGEYLERERGSVRTGEALFLNSQGRPLSPENVSRTFKDLAAECGFIKLKTPRCSKCGGETKKKTVWTYGGERKRGKVHYVCLSCGYLAPVSKAYRGMKSARYRVKAHELRDLAKTLWYRSGTPEKWMADFFSGRIDQVDPNDYLKAMDLYPDWMEDTYRQNLSWLNVLSEDPEKIPVKEVTKMQRRYEEAYKQIREELDYLKELVEERK